MISNLQKSCKNNIKWTPDTFFTQNNLLICFNAFFLYVCTRVDWGFEFLAGIPKRVIAILSASHQKGTWYQFTLLLVRVIDHLATSLPFQR